MEECIHGEEEIVYNFSIKFVSIKLVSVVRCHRGTSASKFGANAREVTAVRRKVQNIGFNLCLLTEPRPDATVRRPDLPKRLTCS